MLIKISTWYLRFYETMDSCRSICSDRPAVSLNLDVGEGSWGKNKLVESSEEGSHEGVRLGNIDLAGVVNVELSPGSWVELSHVSLHLGLGDLLGNKEDLGGGLLATILIEHLLTGLLSSGVGDLDGVVVEDVVHNIVLISTVVSGSWGISGGWWWVFLLLLLVKGNSLDVLVSGESEECSHSNDAGKSHL